MNKGQNKISFIPKKLIVKNTHSRARPISLLLTISSTLFIISILSYGGLYLYNDSLMKVLEEKNTELDLERTQVDPTGVVDRALDLENRTAGAQKLLDTHIAPSRAFTFLEDIILKSVIFDEFTFSADKENDSSVYVLSIAGVATSYASLAAQADVLRDEMSKGKSRFKDFSFFDMGLDSGGNVTFSLSITLSERAVYYKNLIKKDTFTIADTDTEEDSPAGNLHDDFGFASESLDESEKQDVVDIINQAEKATE